MDYRYSFLILLLPFLSFLVLGLAGMKMKEKLAFADACAPGSRELARSVGEAAVKGQAVFMKEHGLCVYGKTAGEVLAVSEEMDHLAAMQLLAAGCRR